MNHDWARQHHLNADTGSAFDLIPNSLEVPPLYATEHENDPVVFVKLFMPSSSWSWHVMEYDRQTGMCFGLVVGFETECCQFNLNSLASSRGPFDERVERDLHFKPTRLSEIRRELVHARRVELPFRNVLLLSCRGVDTSDYGNCDLAIVELSSDLVETIRQRQSICRQLHQNDSQVCSLHYWDDSPVLFSVDAHDSDEIRDIVRNDTFGEIHRVGQSPIVIDDPKQVDRCCMEITPEHLRWTAYPKYEAIQKIVSCDVEIARLVQSFEIDLRTEDFDRGL